MPSFIADDSVVVYSQERTKNAQFIIISLRNNMFELADRLVGIYKTDNTTKSITVDPFKIAQNIQSKMTGAGGGGGGGGGGRVTTPEM